MTILENASPPDLVQFLTADETARQAAIDRVILVRGYTLRQFEDASPRYLPASPTTPETVNPSTDRVNTGENEVLKPSTESVVDTSENAVSPNKDAGGGRVDTFKPGYGGK